MEQLQQDLAALCSQVFGEEIGVESITLSPPPKKDLGDLCFGLFEFMKRFRMSPVDIGSKLTESLGEQGSSTIDSLTQVGPYINIKIKKSYYACVFADFFTHKRYYNVRSDINETVIVDYIGANVGKPLHIGHICTPLQGQTCINVLRKLGYTVFGDSHIGDWGIIFGKLIIGYSYYGDDTKLQENAIEHLFDIYVKISSDVENDSELEQKFRDAFKLLSSGDTDSIEMWKKITSSSIDSMNLLLNRLLVFPDFNIGESFYEGLGLPKLGDYPDLTYAMHEIVEELIAKGIATKNDDNSVGVVFSEDSKLPSCILQKRDGTHGYLASDLACIKYRVENWNPSRILYFVDVRQQLHFRQAFEIAKQADWLKDTHLFHAANGFISLKDGAMSTRKGRIIKLGALLDEAHIRAKNIIDEKRSDISDEEIHVLAEQVGIGAIKYGYLKKSRELDSVFDWDEYMTFEGNSGPYIQYAYVRAVKILGQADITDFSDLNFEYILDRETQFIQKLGEFPSLIDEISHSYSFHQLCLYLYELTKIFSSYYAEVSVLGESNLTLKHARLALLKCFTEILEEGFSILGIELPYEM